MRLLVGMVQAAFLCGALAAGASAQVPPMAAVGVGAAYEFESLWPALPDDWYFNQPTGVATGKAGNVYAVHGFNCV